MLWTILGILLLLWMIQFGFNVGSYVVPFLMIGIWVTFIILLFIPARSMRG